MTRKVAYAIIALVTFTLVTLAIAGESADADATRPATIRWTHTQASWYGPGFYGNRFACAGRPGLPVTYRYRTRGVAHRTLPCGTDLVICWRRPGARRYTCIKVKVIDRGPYGTRGRDLDLTARSAMDLICGPRRECRPHTLNGVKYHA